MYTKKLKLNANFEKLTGNYLFATVSQKVKAYQTNHPHAPLYKLGIGDVSLPVAPVVAHALRQAATEMADIKTVQGYGDYEGLPSLRTAIAQRYGDFRLSPQEIFVTDGAKNSFNHLFELFDFDTVLMPDPVYPVYRDASLLKNKKIVYVHATPANHFLPLPSDIPPHATPHIIFLCSPNNPTGAVYTTAQLLLWVDYALSHKAVILFDGAYRDYIKDDSLPKSIYQIPDAKKCAIEICSFSKSDGFTGLRCGYVVIPQDLLIAQKSVNQLFVRYLATNTNGVSFVVQKAALAALSPEGQAYSDYCINLYMQNAHAMHTTLQSTQAIFVGGKNAPYLWLQSPAHLDGSSFFEQLLHNHGIITTPGAGFGTQGQSYIRLSAFGSATSTQQAVQMIAQYYT
ncbi:MAG: LL-diaminopimelate aminotransferase [Firmicutes bacterium]|nr:LL-diaminopimelate aminotransferase [Bacillota bacterium]